jgi:hypothetical protein
MRDLMIETRAGATEPCALEIRPATGGPPRKHGAALTRQQRRLVDRVNKRDGRWFATHPDHLERTRPIVRGEFAPLVESPTWTHVRVTRVGGMRARIPLERSNQ